MHPFAFGRGLDTRRMREVLGYEPGYTTRAAYEDYEFHLAYHATMQFCAVELSIALHSAPKNWIAGPPA